MMKLRVVRALAGLTLVLITFLAALSPVSRGARAQSGQQLDLNGLWQTDEGETVLLIQNGNGLTSTFGEAAACPLGGTRPYYIEGQLQGTTLSGTMELCTPSDQQRYLQACNLSDPWQTTFTATASQDSITGTYLSPYYNIQMKDGQIVSCTRDASGDEYGSFSIFRLNSTPTPTATTSPSNPTPPIATPGASSGFFTPDQKNELFKAAAVQGVFVGVLGVCVFVTGLAPEPLISKAFAVACGFGAAAFTLSAAVCALLGLDPPDPDFRTIATPVLHRAPTVQATGGLTPREAGTINQLLSDGAQMVALTYAITTSINREHGAQDAGQPYWVQQQRQAAGQYASRLADLIAQQSDLLNALRSALEAAGVHHVTFTMKNVRRFQRSAAAKGLPQSITRTLAQEGLKKADIKLVRQIVVKASSRAVAANSLPESLTSPQITSALQQTARVLRQFAASARG